VGFFLCQVYWKLQDNNPVPTQGESVLDEIASRDNTPLLDIVIWVLETKILQLVRLTLRNASYAARNVVPVDPCREFVAVCRISSLERANADFIQEPAEVHRVRTGCADDPRDAINRRSRNTIASLCRIIEQRSSGIISTVELLQPRRDVSAAFGWHTHIPPESIISAIYRIIIAI
jgi:hypothetical protein